MTAQTLKREMHISLIIKQNIIQGSLDHCFIQPNTKPKMWPKAKQNCDHRHDRLHHSKHRTTHTNTNNYYNIHVPTNTKSNITSPHMNMLDEPGTHPWSSNTSPAELLLQGKNLLSPVPLNGVNNLLTKIPLLLLL